MRSGMYYSFDEECKARKGIVVINNKDNLCLPRALERLWLRLLMTLSIRLFDKMIKKLTVGAQELLPRARWRCPRVVQGFRVGKVPRPT